jgi:hypothetical protein
VNFGANRATGFFRYFDTKVVNCIFLSSSGFVLTKATLGVFSAINFASPASPLSILL